jgi:hypothetical protein
MATSPFTHPQLYRTITIGGVESPGVVVLSGHDRTQEWEIRKSKGTTGSRLINHGRNITQFTATFQLADQDDFDAWESFAKMLAATIAGSGTPKALSCLHPDLVAQGIIEIVVQSVGGLVHDGKGMSTAAIKLIEHTPTKKHTPAQPAARKGTTVLDPNAAAKAELTKLLDQAKAP